MNQVRYFALIDEINPRSNPLGVVRRREIDGREVDEAFTRNLIWENSDYFDLYRLGHNEVDHVEITAREAEAFIEMIMRRLGTK